MKILAFALLVSLLAVLASCGSPSPGSAAPLQGAQTIGGSQGQTTGTEGLNQYITNWHLPILAASKVHIETGPSGTAAVTVEGAPDAEIRVQNGDFGLRIAEGAQNNTGSSGGQQGAASGSSTAGSSSVDRASSTPPPTPAPE